MGDLLYLKTSRGIKAVNINRNLAPDEKIFIKNTPTNQRGTKVLRNAKGTLYRQLEFTDLKGKRQERITGQATTTQNETVSRNWRELQIRAFKNAEWKYREITNLGSKEYQIRQLDFYIIYYANGETEGNLTNRKMFKQDAVDGISIEFGTAKEKRLQEITKKYRSQTTKEKKTQQIKKKYTKQNRKKKTSTTKQTNNKKKQKETRLSTRTTKTLIKRKKR